MIVYNLSLNKLRVKKLPEIGSAIFEVEYSVNTHSEENPECTYYIGGKYSLSIDDIDTNSFINFENVDKNIVLGWILEKEGVETASNLPFVKKAIEEVEFQLKILSEESEVNVTDWKFTNN